MKKLFKLRQWLTLEEAARHLSILLNEPVSVPDVLRLGLDGHLTLSADFVNHTRARLGVVYEYSEVPKHALPPITRDGLPGEPVIVPDGMLLDRDSFPISESTRFVHFEAPVRTIAGVWDLSMLGNEQIDIEFKFQQLTGGPAVELINIDGTFVSRPDGTWASLQEQFDEKWYVDSSEERKKFKTSDYPAGRLPPDAVLVVRTAVLNEFERTLSMSGEPAAPAKEAELSTKERNTLLTLVGVLAQEAKIDISTPSKAATAIESAAVLRGLAISRRTIEEHLMKVPAALATKIK